MKKQPTSDELFAKRVVIFTLFCLAIALGVAMSAACYQLLDEQAQAGNPVIILET